MTEVKNYLAYLQKKLDPRLFREECRKGFANICEQFGEIRSQETIQEIHLSSYARECDYSIKIAVNGHEKVKEYWLELDDSACMAAPIKPCYFVDARAVKPGKENAWLFEDILPEMLGKQEISVLLPNILKCIESLSGKAAGLFQVGIMQGRGAEGIRIFTDDMKREAVLEYLESLDWEGNRGNLRKLLEELTVYSENGNFILDFDVTSHGISKRIGINFGSKTKKERDIRALMNYFVQKHLCIPEKMDGVMDWVKRFPSHTPFIQNDISHFKIPFDGETAMEAKAYLRQGCVLYVDFPAFETPCIMNLELTTKCPLACPQCYCSLEGAKDLSLDEALYWISEAWKNGVAAVNLSGGESMCYPHLYEVVKAVSERGMEANVAISGAYFGKEEIRRLEEAGIHEIYVSLNAPDEETNSLTRDGYQLAIKALEALREYGFPRTCINWVMHNNNGNTLEKMLELAEAYRVSSFAVMVFKPDAKNQRKSLPSLEQLYSAAAFLKKYRGPVRIEVESCFSQLKALLGQRFFTNLNIGIAKGCGAGRDAISINVDGRITPCRHLEIAENYRTISSYWKESLVLDKLRTVEQAMRAPCAGCRYRAYCLPCMAVNYKMYNEIYMGEEACKLWMKPVN